MDPKNNGACRRRLFHDGHRRRFAGFLRRIVAPQFARSNVSRINICLCHYQKYAVCLRVYAGPRAEQILILADSTNSLIRTIKVPVRIEMRRKQFSDRHRFAITCWTCFDDRWSGTRRKKQRNKSNRDAPRYKNIIQIRQRPPTVAAGNSLADPSRATREN